MLTLKLEVSAGTVIDNAVDEAKETAIRLRLCVEFDFNGVKFHANYLLNNSTSDAVKRYHEALKSGREFKFVNY